MRIPIRSVCLALLAGLAWSSASADEVTVNVTARVTYISDPRDALSGQVQLGETFSGYYRYDSSAEGHYSAPNVVGYAIPGYGGGLRLTNGAVIIETQPTSNPIGSVEVGNNPSFGGADWLALSFSPGDLFNHVRFNFYDDSGQALSSNELPATAPELKKYSERSVTISGNGNSGFFFFVLEVESVELAPPPSFEVSPQSGTFLPQQRFDAALYLPAGSMAWYAQAYANGQSLSLTYPGNCDFTPPNSSGLPTLFCPDAHTALATVPSITQVEWRVYLFDGTVLKKVVDWKRLQ